MKNKTRLAILEAVTELIHQTDLTLYTLHNLRRARIALSQVLKKHSAAQAAKRKGNYVADSPDVTPCRARRSKNLKNSGSGLRVC